MSCDPRSSGAGHQVQGCGMAPGVGQCGSSATHVIGSTELKMVYSLTSAAGDLLRLPGLSVPSAATPGMAARDQGTRQSEPEAAVSSRVAISCIVPGSGWGKTEAGPLCSAPKGWGGWSLTAIYFSCQGHSF